MRLAERVAIVTGGSRGIGAAVAKGLAAEGAKVAVNYASNEQAATGVVDTIIATGGQAIAVRGDVASSSDVAAVVATTVESFGTVDILVNNAALTDTHKPWLSITEDEWDRVLAVNLKSCFLCARAVYPFMRTRGGGRIINMSSVTFLLGRPNLLHYVSSKGGIIGFTRTLAREVGPDGITVNTITPGAIQTESELEMFPEQESVACFLMDVQAVKRRGLPADLVGAAVFLASEESSFVTGQILNVDGGWAMH
jgi:3-oxoacyl-[acyl-carrier protein] reductase